MAGLSYWLLGSPPWYCRGYSSNDAVQNGLSVTIPSTIHEGYDHAASLEPDGMRRLARDRIKGFDLQSKDILGRVSAEKLKRIS